MKTVEEAINSVIQIVNSKTQYNKAKEEGYSIASKYESLVKEVIETENVQLLINQLLEDEICCMKHVREALISAFVNGLVIGIEMTKESE